MNSETESKTEGVIVITKGLLVNPIEPHREVWLNIPYEQDELWTAKESTGVDGGVDLPFSAYGGYLKSGECRIEFESMDELLEHFKDYEYAVHNTKLKSDKLKAILELEQCSSTSKAKYLMECMDDFEFYSEATDLEKFGKELFKKQYGDEVVKESGSYIDFESFADEYVTFHDYGCAITSIGAVERKKSFVPFEDIEENEMTMS